MTKLRDGDLTLLSDDIYYFTTSLQTRNHTHRTQYYIEERGKEGAATEQNEKSYRLEGESMFVIFLSVRDSSLFPYS
jgi:hypothetical protein